MMEETFEGVPTDRLKRAFGWIVSFRDFTQGCRQVFGGNGTDVEAISLLTKGRYEHYYKGGRNPDRVSGDITSEIADYWTQGVFEHKYVEPSTRVCIYRWFNNGRLPEVRKIEMQEGEEILLPAGAKLLICLGSVQAADKVFEEESVLMVGGTPRHCKAIQRNVLMLDFTNAGYRQ